MIQNLFSKTISRLRGLSPKVNVLIAFALGAGTIVVLQYRGLILLSLFAILIAVLLANLNQSRFSNFGGYIGFLVGIIGTAIIYNSLGSPSHSESVIDILVNYITIFTIAWMLLQLFVEYGKGIEKTPYSYWIHTFVWLFLFYISFAMKYLFTAGLILLGIVKFYQIFLIGHWTKSVKQAFVFSVLFPLGLYVALQTYAHFYIPSVYRTATQVEQQILTYHDKHGEYPPDEYFDSDDISPVSYYMNHDNKPWLRYSKPMHAGCSYYYDFKIRDWVERCLD